LVAIWAFVKSFSRLFLTLSILLVVVATALRGYHLGARSLWFDEALAANISRGRLTPTEEGFRTNGPPHEALAENSVRRLLDDTRELNSAPLAHPYILFLVQRVWRGATAVRTPSVIASILSVVILLMIPGGDRASLFAAALLTVSPTQIRYAQEVREYSLSVLFAAIMLYYFLSAHCGAGARKQPGMYVVFLLGPFVQYGLALFAAGIIGAMLLSLALEQLSPFQPRRVLLALSALVTGSVSSYILTLRDQFGPRPPYLAGNYFTSGTASLTAFVIDNTRQLAKFVIPSKLLLVVIGVGAIKLCYDCLRSRRYEPVIIATVMTVLVVLVASLAGLYPYGGIRQCIFLAPVICLFAGRALDSLTETTHTFDTLVTAVLLAIIAAAGARELTVYSPYSEVEDVGGLLNTLRASASDGDLVYVYWGAVPAVNFYTPLTNARFVFGTYDRNDPTVYPTEVRAAAANAGARLWLMFTHFGTRDRESIVHALAPGWNVRLAKSGTGAVLYLGERKRTP
jgi:hypothetical protein